MHVCRAEEIRRAQEMVALVMTVISLFQAATSHSCQLCPPSNMCDADGKGIGNLQTDQILSQ